MAESITLCDVEKEWVYVYLLCNTGRRIIQLISLYTGLVYDERRIKGLCGENPHGDVGGNDVRSGP